MYNCLIVPRYYIRTRIYAMEMSGFGNESLFAQKREKKEYNNTSGAVARGENVKLSENPDMLIPSSIHIFSLIHLIVFYY